MAASKSHIKDLEMRNHQRDDLIGKAISSKYVGAFKARKQSPF